MGTHWAQPESARPTASSEERSSAAGRWRRLGAALWFAWAASAPAAEIAIDFSQYRQGECPPGFRSTVTGEGKPGDWQIRYEPLEDREGAVPSSVVTRQAVLAQLARDPTDEHFPLLIYEPEVFGDFRFVTRFKTVAGEVERMAGIAFRIQDERNYYVVRASSLGRSFRFYKVVGGGRTPPIGVEVEVPSGVWHELAVECKANQIRCQLNGKELFPPLTDSSFAQGKVGFWTKSDSVSYFANPRITYTPREIRASVLLREVRERYPRLLGLAITGRPAPGEGFQILASLDDAEVGEPARPAELEAINRETVYSGKAGDRSIVVLPIRDRNGEPVAAVRVILKRFPGQTRNNAVTRAMPIARHIQRGILSAGDLAR